jgi:hypothetical protein
LAITRKEKQTDRLRVAHPLADEGVWCIVGDAYNSCCHRQRWRENAERKWVALGLRPVWYRRKPASFKGVGNKSATGKLKIPIVLELEESKIELPGANTIHEIPDADRPMLLSQAAQAKLGFTKNMRQGRQATERYSLLQWFLGSHATSDEECDGQETGFMGAQIGSATIDEKMSRAGAILVSCGVRSFEHTSYTTGASTEFNDFSRTRPSGLGL